MLPEEELVGSGWQISCKREAAESSTAEPTQRCDESDSYPIGGQLASHPTCVWAMVLGARPKRRVSV